VNLASDRRVVSADYVCKRRTDYSPVTAFAGGTDIGDPKRALQRLDGYPVDLDVVRVPRVSFGGSQVRESSLAMVESSTGAAKSAS